MGRRYHILDVFTETAFAGNPLAVVLDSLGLDTAAMQRVAREFNLSETVFVAAPRDPINSAAVRIFTPTAELPFAGHPTIGTAILLATEGAPELIAREVVGIALEEQIGMISCTVRHRRGEAAHASFEAPRLAERWGEPPPIDDIAAMLGLAAADIGFGPHRPCCFTAGNDALFVPLASLDALGRAWLDGPADTKRMVYLYTPAPPGAAGHRTFRARMLSQGLGVPEDPATGSVAAAFPGVLLAAERLADGEHDCVLSQGVEMGRPSRIGLAFSVEGGRLASTIIGGHAVMVAQGTIEI